MFTGTSDPASQAYLQLYGLMAVMGVIIILSVQALVSLSILIYFPASTRRRGALVEDDGRAGAWPSSPRSFVVYLLFKNILFLGSGYSYAIWLGPIDLLVVPESASARRST